jgi:hypothetical protein
MVPAQPQFEMTVEELGKLAAQWAQSTNDPIGPQYSAVEVEACIAIANIKLTWEEFAIRKKQIELAQNANSLSERLLKSNEEAGQASANSALALNAATEGLAKSTSGLNRATWILALFTGIQVLITVLGFWNSLRGK